MVKKRGQAALEFLTTYGWAFIVILTMISALSYFGVLSPSNFVGDRCVLGSPFVCDTNQFVVGEEGLRMAIRASSDENIIVSNMQYEIDGEWQDCAFFPQTTISQSAVITCEFNENLNTQSANVKVRFNYRPARADETFTRTAQGNINSRVETQIPLYDFQPITECGSIDQPGYYMLQNNLSTSQTCIQITASDVLVDGANHLIEYGSDSSGFGIRAQNQENVVIRNVQVQELSTSGSFKHAIYFQNTPNSYAFNNVATTISSNSAAIIFFGGSHNGVVSGNEAYGLGSNGHALHAVNSNNMLFEDNFAQVDGDWATGIYPGSNSRSIIRGNTVHTNSMTYAIYLWDHTQSLVEDNEVITNEYFGMGIGVDSNEHIVRNNRVYTQDDLGYGIQLDLNAANNIIENNYVETHGDSWGLGILLQGDANNNVIRRNIVNITGSGSAALYVYEGAHTNAFYENILTSESYHISLWTDAGLGNHFFDNELLGQGLYVGNGVSALFERNYYLGIESLDVIDSSSDGFGDSGADYPLNEVNWPSKWEGVGEDASPRMNPLN